MINAPAWCANAWVAHGAFQNLGYPSDELFFGCVEVVDGAGKNHGQHIVVQLQRKKREFTWTLDPVPGMAPERAQEKWKEFAAYMNAAGEAERRAVWISSSIVRDGGPTYIALAQGLAAKGIDVPNFPQADVLWGPPRGAS